MRDHVDKYNCSDALGSNVASVNAATAAIDQRMAYQAYGTPEELNATFTPTPASDDWEFRFAGYRYESHTGLYQVRWRYLNSRVGTWLGRDPFEFYEDEYEEAIASYRYCDSNPISVFDPMGERPCPPAVFNRMLTNCRNKNSGANRTWLIFGCKIVEIEFRYGIYPFCFTRKTEQPGSCCFGPCQFYLGWCKWGARLPANDPGKKFWRLSLWECERCADSCVINKGKWKCPFGGGKRGPRWPSSKTPFVPVWDDATKLAVLECQLNYAPAGGGFPGGGILNIDGIDRL